MASAAPPAPRAAGLQDVPQELLTRILSLACADDGVSAEHLFRLGGLCVALRRAAGSVDGAAASVAAKSWTRAIFALVDPAGALVAACSAREGGLCAAPACYLAHARALGGWYRLAHALADRDCVVCGDVTQWLAWRRPAADGAADAGVGGVVFGLRRCCAECTPPAAEDAEEDSASDGSEESDDGFLRCALVNQQFFVAEPTVVLDAADWEHPAERLAACLREASEGDTIGLRGEFRSLRAFCFPKLSAVRLLGMPPAAAPWRCVHAHAPNDTPGQRMEQLLRFERESAAALGFPGGASIHVESNCVEVHGTAWCENISISSGPRNMGSQLPGEHVHVEEGIREAGAYFSGIGMFLAYCGGNGRRIRAAIPRAAPLLADGVLRHQLGAGRGHLRGAASSPTRARATFSCRPARRCACAAAACCAACCTTRKRTTWRTRCPSRCARWSLQTTSSALRQRRGRPSSPAAAHLLLRWRARCRTSPRTT
jgi:hypothetical protein